MKIQYFIYFYIISFLMLLAGIGCDKPSNTKYNPISNNYNQEKSTFRYRKILKENVCHSEEKKDITELQNKINRFKSQPKTMDKKYIVDKTLKRKSGEHPSRSISFPKSEKLERHRRIHSQNKKLSSISNKHYAADGECNAPLEWVSFNIEKSPSLKDCEIWNRIIGSVRKFIVSSKVIFSPLGAKHTSLEHLEPGKYKIIGHCLVFDEHGKLIPYEFECIFYASQYDSRIIYINFTKWKNKEQ